MFFVRSYCTSGFIMNKISQSKEYISDVHVINEVIPPQPPFVISQKSVLAEVG